MIAEDAILDFAATLFKSVWALELLLWLKRRSNRSWQPSQIISELRGSRLVVAEALTNLMSTGLVVEDEEKSYRYHPGSPGMDEMVDELEKLYAQKPTSVIRKIVSSPNAKLQILSDAFRIKE